MSPSGADEYDRVRAKLREIWGYEDFRPPQGEIVRTLLEGRDAAIVLPTGGGKSICFQLPALLQTGLTLVVSPLVALMENQVQELRDRRLPAALLHGQLDRRVRRDTLNAIERNRLRLLYLSPETLLSPPVWERLCQPQVRINGSILDEAHCLVQWGDTFRPAYRRLGAVRPALLKTKPPGTKIAIAAFTATADPEAQQTIATVLGLQRPRQFLYSPYRENLYLALKVAWTPRDRRQKLFKFIQSQGKTSGLVYVRTRGDSEKLAREASARGYAVAAYHAGLSGEERRAIERGWIENQLQFVVCTSAFGMGVNKPDVRWVAHFQAPALLSEYVQEVGRAGRDGRSARALTLVSECTGLLDPEDKQRRESVRRQQREIFKRSRQLAKQFPQQGEVEAIARQFREGAIALSVLHCCGGLQWRDPFHYQLVPGGGSGRGVPAIDATGTMARYVKWRGCRWQFLLAAFGFKSESAVMHCGHCDNCFPHKFNSS
ncbi:RecQ family ATP-dependent DNA helicase [Oxynema aestuarii]|uniref:ATP-dependent DNA helicase RecQ n=1 Tax=Oxynema aestuarii AP17 TaxID=2064643 RepID=A0A6H1TYX7_9CYAN|nr:RecQ family ATP-dependent DNA helicase [Oxynema aestuarii]QIZ71781.1 ATP-dependent DNA helicase RecQ [Oxynema aestuarii AP17]